MNAHRHDYLEVRNLNIKLGAFELRNIELQIKSGTYLILLGEIGSGKSVFLKTIAGFFEPDSGEVWLDGVKINKLPPNIRGIGYVPQHNDLFPNMSVRRNIAFPIQLRCRGDNNSVRKKTDELISLFGLAKIADRSIANLSGGERKKTAIARALASEPKILLLDEPFSMLDPSSRRSVLEIIRNLHERTNITILHVSHDRADAWELGKLCAIMEKGRIIQCAEISEIFRKPKTAELARFIGCENVFPAKFANCQDNVFVEIGNGLRLRIDTKISDRHGFAVIRPELIKIVDDEQVNCFEAIIKSLSDRGEFCEIRIVLSDIEMVLHCSLNEAKNLSVSSKIKIHIHPGDIHCTME